MIIKKQIETETKEILSAVVNGVKSLVRHNFLNDAKRFFRGKRDYEKRMNC